MIEPNTALLESNTEYSNSLSEEVWSFIGEQCTKHKGTHKFTYSQLKNTSKFMTRSPNFLQMSLDLLLQDGRIEITAESSRSRIKEYAVNASEALKSFSLENDASSEVDEDLHETESDPYHGVRKYTDYSGEDHSNGSIVSAILQSHGKKVKMAHPFPPNPPIPPPLSTNSISHHQPNPPIPLSTLNTILSTLIALKFRYRGVPYPLLLATLRGKGVQDGFIELGIEYLGIGGVGKVCVGEEGVQFC